VKRVQVEVCAYQAPDGNRRLYAFKRGNGDKFGMLSLFQELSCLSVLFSRHIVSLEHIVVDDVWTLPWGATSPVETRQVVGYLMPLACSTAAKLFVHYGVPHRPELVSLGPDCLRLHDADLLDVIRQVSSQSLACCLC
jgi:hypothetical protein